MHTCIDCDVGLVIGENWSASHASSREYICSPCYKVRNNRRMYVNGKYVSMKHPLWKPGRYKIDGVFGEAAVESDTDKRGFVYCITNPAWPGMVKIGKAIDVAKRHAAYQTYSPFRDFKLEWTVEVEDVHAVEQEFHRVYKKTFAREDEWYPMGVGEAYTLIHSIPHVGVVDVQEDH